MKKRQVICLIEFKVMIIKILAELEKRAEDITSNGGHLIFFFLTFIYFWDRERQSINGGGAEREGDTESETGSRL